MLRLQRSPSRICGGQSGTETVLCPYSPVFSLSLSLSFSVSASLSRTIRLQWVQVGFVVDKVARKQFSLHILQYFLFLPLPLSLSLIPFDCRAVQVGFVVDKVALKQFSLLILQYFLFLPLPLSLSISHTIRLQSSPSRICGGQSGTETVLSPYSSVFSVSLSLSFHRYALRMRRFTSPTLQYLSCWHCR